MIMIMKSFKFPTTPSTYLSENVCEVLINLRSTYFCENTVVDEDMLLSWDKIDNELKNISVCGCILDKSWEWYRHKIKILWGIVQSANEKFRISSSSEKEKLFKLSSWVFNLSEIIDIYNKFETYGESEILFCVLKLTSYLDRALGDIYKSACGHDPFLLKDMLASDILSEVIGRTETKFLQLLFGTVKGMNLRNIAWHGFFSPGELHQSIIPALFLVTASLGFSLKEFERRPTIKSESVSKYSQYYEPFFFFQISFSSQKFLDAVMICPFISKSHWGYWKYASDLYMKGCYGDSLIFLMPLMENILRSMFCYANDCSERILTAEATSFYTTLDDIFAHNVGSSENRLDLVIGSKMLEILLDLYIYEDGPRIRDRISHSEIKPYDVSEDITRCVFVISLLLIMLSTINVKKEHTDYKTLFGSEYSSLLIGVTLKYESQFHPTCLLKRSLVNIISEIASWNKLPTPPELAHLTNNEHDKVIDLFRNITGHNDFVNYSHEVIEKLINLKPATIYRPKHEMELISMLRKIVSCLEVVNGNIVESCETKHYHWEKKQMKSRSRENYKRMLNCIPSLQLGIGCVCHIMYFTLKELNNQEIEGVKKIHRFFRACQKYVENASTMSAIKKNRWVELKQSTLDICNLIVSESLFSIK